MARDAQRGRFYRAEAQAMLYKCNPVEPGEEILSVERVQRMVDLILATPSVRERFGGVPHRITVRHTKARKGFASGGCEIALPDWVRRPCNYGYVLHEITHCLLTTQVWRERRAEEPPWHGWEFAAAYLWMVDYFMGQTVAERLRERYRACRVRYRRPPEISPERRAALRQAALEWAARQRALAAGAQARPAGAGSRSSGDLP